MYIVKNIIMPKKVAGLSEEVSNSVVGNSASVPRSVHMYPPSTVR